MQFSVTPVEFELLQVDLEKSDQIKSLTMSSPDSGTLVTSDVTLACSYDGSSTLFVTVTGKHSLAAKFAPESVIEKHVAELLNQFLQAK